MSKTTDRVTATDKAINFAIAQGKLASIKEPLAIGADFDPDSDMLTIRFNNLSELRLPRKLLQGLEHAKPQDVSKIEILGLGTGLHWPKLDVDHYVPGLLAGIFGTRRWMVDLGRKGGLKRTPAKIAAARANGKRGGRPRSTKGTTHK